MRPKRCLSALAALGTILAVTAAPAQTVSYINFLQFDLQSYTSQATGGIFQDDVDWVADASKLTMIEGNRLFTNFANLADPATLGDNVLSYSIDHIGTPSTSDEFDTGSYLLGWIGKYDRDSEYTFELFYQRNGTKSMFEDLQDFSLGTVGGGGFDAEYTGFTRTTVHDPGDGSVTGDVLTNVDLTRYDQRSAVNLDFGAARDLSEDLSLGGRLFWESDQLDSHSEGEVETVSRTADGSGGFTIDSRSVTTWIGNGDEAFKHREAGVSLDANYHPWDDQDIGIRVDVFDTKLVNPGSSLSGAATLTRIGGQPSGPFDDVGTRVNLRTDTDYVTVAAGTDAAGTGTVLDSAHEQVVASTTSPYAFPNYGGFRGAATTVAAVDDERTGIGFAAKGEWNREWAGGENTAWAGFSHRGLDVDANVLQKDVVFSTLWWNAGGDDTEAVFTASDATTTTMRDGDMTVDVFEVGTRWTRDLNRHVGVGLGAILTRENRTEDYRQTATDVDITDKFDDGDPGTNTLFAASGNPAHNERETVAESTSISDVNDETRTTFLRLPVGAQFHFKERWTVNLGVQHLIASSTRETQLATPASGNGQVVTTVRDFGAGTETVSYAALGSEEDVTVTDKARTNHTTYWYGISVMITDSAQLDINGFLDSASDDQDLDRAGDPNFDSGNQILDVDFFRNLAISLKYIFW